MPTYSYRCTACGTAFDAVQAFTDDSLTVCPSCGGRLRKLYGTVGVTFNGSGFYRNDSRSPSAPATATASAPDSASSSGSPGVASPSTSSAPAASASTE